MLDGEDIVIATDQRQIRLSAVPPAVEFNEASARRRGFGVLKGRLVVGPEFFEPLSDEECGLGGDEKARP